MKISGRDFWRPIVGLVALQPLTIIWCLIFNIAYLKISVYFLLFAPFTLFLFMLGMNENVIFWKRTLNLWGGLIENPRPE